MQQDESLREELLAEVAAIAPILQELAYASEKLVPGIRGITTGTFDDPNWIKPTAHMWT